MSNTIIETSDERFDQDVLRSAQPVLVDFYADWCGPCKTLAPALDDMLREYQDEIRIVKVDVDKCPELTRVYGVRSIPAVMTFHQGERAEILKHPVTRSSMANALDKLLGSA